MNKGFIFVIDALWALAVLGFLFAGVSTTNDLPNETSAAIASSVQARDAAVVYLHIPLEYPGFPAILNENSINITPQDSHYSKVCFTAIKGNSKQFCRVID